MRDTLFCHACCQFIATDFLLYVPLKWNIVAILGGFDASGLFSLCWSLSSCSNINQVVIVRICAIAYKHRNELVESLNSTFLSRKQMLSEFWSIIVGELVGNAQCCYIIFCMINSLFFCWQYHTKRECFCSITEIIQFSLSVYCNENYANIYWPDQCDWLVEWLLVI